MKANLFVRSSLISGTCAFAILVGSQIASANDNPNRGKHPRREQVNRRAERQEDRTHRALENGKLTPEQAAKLNAQDEKIQAREEALASKHGGHLTKNEQKRLNRAENHVNRERRRMIRRNEKQSSGGEVSSPSAEAPQSAPQGN